MAAGFLAKIIEERLHLFERRQARLGIDGAGLFGFRHLPVMPSGKGIDF